MGWRDTIKKEEPSQQPSGSWRDSIKKAEPLPDPSMIDKASAFGEKFKENYPLSGLAEKAGRGVRAGMVKMFGERPGPEPDEDYGDIYERLKQRDEEEKLRRNVEIEKEGTGTAATYGSIGGVLAAPNPASIAGRMGLNVADAAARAENPMEALSNAESAAKISALVESLPYAGKVVKSVGGKFGKSAEALAEKATGATRVQAEKFKDGSGRALLDNDIVTFGSSPKNISDNAADVLSAANKNLDDSLSKLDTEAVIKNGQVTYPRISKDELVYDIENEIMKLKDSSANADVVRQMEKALEDISAGKQNLSLAEAEKLKRQYYEKVKNWLDPTSAKANKNVARSLKNLVEERSNEINPELAEKFRDSKEAYGLVKPIQEASEKRAKQLSQSPVGGLLDVAALGSGAAASGMSGDPSDFLKGLAFAAGRRVIAPRMASSMARSANSISKVLNRIGDMPIKYQKLLVGSPQEMALIHYILEKDDPEYRKAVDKVSQ